MTIKQMDNVGIVVDDLDATIAFFREPGLELEGQATIKGEWAERITGLHPMHVEMAMMRTPDGHGRLEISSPLRSLITAGPRSTLWASCASCSPWTTSTRRSPASVRSSSATN